MYRLIVKAQGQRNRPPRYDLKLTSIMKRVTELGDVQDNFETDMHVRHQDMMLEMVGLRNDMREMMLRSGHGGKTAGSIARGAKVKLSRWAARARRTSNQNRHQGATAAAASFADVVHRAGEATAEELRRAKEALHAQHRADTEAYVKKSREDQHRKRRKQGRSSGRSTNVVF